MSDVTVRQTDVALAFAPEAALAFASEVALAFGFCDSREAAYRSAESRSEARKAKRLIYCFCRCIFFSRFGPNIAH
jgi:hypothetical protein